MTDVASVAVASGSGLILNTDLTPEAGSDSSRERNRRNSDGIRISGGLRIAVARKGARVEATRVSSPDDAIDAAEKIKEKYSEPVSITYDEEKSRYVVLVGDLKSEESAEKLASRLREAGYRSAAADPPSRNRVEVLARDSETELTWRGRSVAVAAGRPAITPKMASRSISAVAGRRSQSPPAPVFDRRQHSSEIALVKVGSRSYRGSVEVTANSRGLLNVINVVPLEDYLLGVVPAEISPASFPEIEALRAQAVAARTYAIARSTVSDRYKQEGFDLTDDARSQVYGGYSIEHPLTSRAVEETRGMVAVFAGKPIEALYTSTCGGHTENSEGVFPGGAVPYLRAVSCAAGRNSLDQHQIKTSRPADAMTGPDGRAVVRELALLDVLGFGLPRRPSSLYVKANVSRDEVRKWADRAAELTGERRLAATRGDPTRLPGFASLAAAAIFGEASMLMSPADVDYVLEGLGAENVSREARADLALLIAAGILRLGPDSRISESTVSRAQAVEAFARGIAFRFELISAEPAGFVSRVLAARFKAGGIGFQRGVADSAKGGRLVLAEGRAARSSSDDTAGKSSGGGRSSSNNTGLEIDAAAWLFRRLGGESYAVARLVLIGGETITYHLNTAGRVDFLEVDSPSKGAASDRISSAAYWQVRISAGELERRLARARVNVGDLRDMTPVAFGASNRVLELEVSGSRGVARLAGSRVRSVLGLKEALFVITRERNGMPASGGQHSGNAGIPDTYVFTGRGWGHGVGLCQTGAYGLAKEGYTYSDILRTYYSDITIKRLY
jgi:stage II sporulation protein D